MCTQFDIPSRPMTYFREGPACRGACSQGRGECPHPMLCRACLTDDELADVLTEMDHDTRPATLDDARAAAGGVWSGACDLAGLPAGLPWPCGGRCDPPGPREGR